MDNAWYLSLAAGISKDIAPSLSGDGSAAGLQADFGSPLGWFVDFGALWYQNWQTALGASIRYTHARYTYAGESFDASSVGFAMNFSFGR